MIIVTGSKGFIGSNLIKGLNSMGIKDILAVDDHEKLPPSENLSNCEFEDLIKIEDIAENHFSSAYDSLTKIGFDKHSELYKFIKIIQERHS